MNFWFFSENFSPKPLSCKKLNSSYVICFSGKGGVGLIELDKKQVKQIRKLLRNGVEVPDICTQFKIAPENWREATLKYDFYK